MRSAGRRLRRTARFIALTTYGGQEEAKAAPSEDEPRGFVITFDDDDAPEGSESRDEEFEGDDPADIPDEHGGSAASIDTDDNGVDDTTMPEGTDRIIDENDDDWE